MNKLAFLALSCFCSLGFAKERKVANDPAPPAAPTINLPGTTYASEDVFAAGSAYVQSVYCVTAGSSAYAVYSGAPANDVRIARISAGGSVSYEIYKGTRLLGACPMIHVVSR